MMKTLKEEPDYHPKKGWRDVSCEVLLGAAAYRIAMQPDTPNPFELLDRDDPNFTRSWRNDPYGLARRVEALRQIAIPLYKKQEEAEEAKKAKEAGEADDDDDDDDDEDDEAEGTTTASRSASARTTRRLTRPQRRGAGAQESVLVPLLVLSASAQC